MKYLFWATIVLFIFAVGLGLYFAGSPGAVREKRLDSRRENDLQQLQYEIVSFWQSKEKLPELLTDLKDPLRGFNIPKDPVTLEDYEYHVKNELTFELCANFKTENKNKTPESLVNEYAKPIYDSGISGNSNWEHNAERTCFERTIDRDFFRTMDEQLKIKQ